MDTSNLPCAEKVEVVEGTQEVLRNPFVASHEKAGLIFFFMWLGIGDRNSRLFFFQLILLE